MKCASANCGRTACYFALWRNVRTVLCFLCGQDAKTAKLPVFVIGK